MEGSWIAREAFDVPLDQIWIRALKDSEKSFVKVSFEVNTSAW